MNSDDEQNRENWVRITLRLPPDLHASLVEAARLTSLNAEIIVRLEESFRARFFEANERLARLEDELLEAKRSFRADYEKLIRNYDKLEVSVLNDMGRQLGKPGSRKPGGTE